jgi:hypothetical protein
MRRLGLHAVFRGDDVVVGLDVRQLGLRVTPGDIARRADKEISGISVLQPGVVVHAAFALFWGIFLFFLQP